MRTESVELFRGPNPPGSKAKPIPQPMRPGSDAVRGGASGEARDAKERFQLPDEATRNKRDPVRREESGSPSGPSGARPDAAGPRSRAGGLGRDEAPGQLLMREILERLGVEGLFKAKAAAGDAGGEGAAIGEANAESAEGQVPAQIILAEQVPTAQDDEAAGASPGAEAATPQETAGADENVGEEAGPAGDEDLADDGSPSDEAWAAAPGIADGGAEAAVDAAPADDLAQDATDDQGSNGQDSRGQDPDNIEHAAEANAEPAPTPAGDAPDAAAAAVASSLAGLNAGEVEAGRGRRSEGGPARNGLANGNGNATPEGAPGIMKRDGLPAQASPVAAANVPFAATVSTDAVATAEVATDELVIDELLQARPGQSASADDAGEADNQPKAAQPPDNPGLRRALGQLGMTPGQGGANPVPAVPGGETAQQGLAQALSGVAEAAGKPAPMVPPAPVVANVPLGAVPIEIGLKALAGVNHFQIRLDPAELGRIDVNLEIDTDGTIKARLSVDRVETLALLQRDARTLERAFEQAGLKPSDSGVDLSLRDQGRDDRRGPPEHGGRENAPAHAKAGGEGETKRPEATVVHQTIWRGAAGVDVRI